MGSGPSDGSYGGVKKLKLFTSVYSGERSRQIKVHMGDVLLACYQNDDTYSNEWAALT